MKSKPPSSPFEIRILKSKREWGIFLIFCILLLSLNLYRYFQHYQFYSQKNPYSFVAEVKLQYQKTKNNKTYFVLKLEDRWGHSFYTTSNLELKTILYRDVRIYGKMAKCSFFEFLRSCYVQTYILALLPENNYKTPLRNWIDSQHQDENSSVLYRALFIADSVNLAWRNFSNATGIAHIIAISGFHLGVLSFVLFLCLAPIYYFFQKRFFPYRNGYYDLSIVILFLMFLYLVLLEFQPSFFRAFLMALGGFFLYFSGLKIISFGMLSAVSVAAIACFPSFVFNIGFILSVFGVFYILLFIKHIPKISWWKYALLFDVSIFLLMGPVVHFYFPYFSIYQFSSIFISMVFVIFFPFVVLLHIFGLGGLLDFIYVWALSFKIPYIEFLMPFWGFVIYVIASILAIKYRQIFILLLGFCILFYLILSLRFFLIL